MYFANLQGFFNTLLSDLLCYGGALCARHSTSRCMTTPVCMGYGHPDIMLTSPCLHPKSIEINQCLSVSRKLVSRKKKALGCMWTKTRTWACTCIIWCYTSWIVDILIYFVETNPGQNLLLLFITPHILDHITALQPGQDITVAYGECLTQPVHTSQIPSRLTFKKVPNSPWLFTDDYACMIMIMTLQFILWTSCYLERSMGIVVLLVRQMHTISDV